LRRRRREGARHGARPRRGARECARAAIEPGRRVPTPHRALVGGLSVSTPAPLRVWESNFAIYRRIWRSNLLGSLLQPFLYLLGMGVGVGALVDDRAGSSELLGGTSYLGFLAPSLIAVTAMMVLAQEAMWPVMDGFTWSNAYRSMHATPLRPAQIAAGVTLWQATRGLLACGGV